MLSSEKDSLYICRDAYMAPDWVSWRKHDLPVQALWCTRMSWSDAIRWIPLECIDCCIWGIIGFAISVLFDMPEDIRCQDQDKNQSAGLMRGRIDGVTSAAANASFQSINCYSTRIGCQWVSVWIHIRGIPQNGQVMIVKAIRLQIWMIYKKMSGSLHKIHVSRILLSAVQWNAELLQYIHC